ncbi:ATP-grasp fold amidoligase family protein [Pseudactinotalea sp.]|uniref:ATP-grasp fold amidoligase family protein n=1 Tax=Pseudactinotalea sp. TaxID=1926260 RepID=UPI003B3A485E
MFGTTRRQRFAIGLIVLLGLATAVSAALGWQRAALVGLSSITVIGVLMLLVVHHRQQSQLAKMAKTVTRELRRQAARDKSARAASRRVAELKQQLAAAKAGNTRLDDLDRASFRQSIRQQIRFFRAEHTLRPKYPSASLQLPFKLRNMELAASHGIKVPEVFKVWPDIDSIDLSVLPDNFVLKSDGGAGSVAVFPLERLAQGRYRMLGTREEIMETDLLDRVRSLGRQARPPYFAEELLYGVGGGPIPDDVKLYMFYGEVGQILVRTVGTHGDASTIRLKFVDEDGHDFGKIAIRRQHDVNIEVPDCLDQMVATARHLSRAVGLPFCRVDLYETSRGIVLGEITRAPSGGNERFVEAHDELLGRRWIQASARLTADLHAGRPIGPLFGTEAALRLYPAGTGDRYPANFTRTTVPCSRWCHAETDAATHPERPHAPEQP